MKKIISVIGCGWLGLPLAESFVPDNHQVYGSTTRREKFASLEEAGIVPFLIHLDQPDEEQITRFLQSDVLIINIPPGRKNPEGYLSQLALLKELVIKSSIKNIVFISSTAVYDAQPGEVDESGLIGKSEKSQRLFSAEELFRQIPGISTTVIRLSGLIGPGRHPGRFFAGKSDIENGLAAVNLVHLTDCIRLIRQVINQDYWNQTLNLSAPSHPTKKDFYTKATLLYGGQSPSFKEEWQADKVISSRKAVDELGFEFQYPDLIKSLDTFS